MGQEKSKPQATALIKFCFLSPSIIMIFFCLASEQAPYGTRGKGGGGGLGARDAPTLTVPQRDCHQAKF